MTSKLFALTTLLALGAGIAQAQEAAEEVDTVEELASEEEVAQVAESIGRIGCTAAEVEKESADLFEVDDATCEIGQYDIKLDGAYAIISLTRDE